MQMLNPLTPLVFLKHGVHPHKLQSMMNRNIGVPTHYVLSQQRNLVISVLLV